MGFQPVPSNWTEERTQALTAFKQAGMSAKEIADRMGLTRGQVLGRLWRIDHPFVPKPRVNAWTHQQMEIVRRGALYGICIDEICELLAKAGREMESKAVQDSRHYRLGLQQARALEERMSHSVADRARLSQNRAAAQPSGEEFIPPGAYRCPHFKSQRINLPIVKGYVGEQAHVQA